MEIPVSIDFSKIYAEKVLYNETYQYKILKDMDESEWKAYRGAMLKENVQVAYDAITDAFIAKPTTKLSLTESRDNIYGVKPQAVLKEAKQRSGFMILRDLGSSYQPTFYDDNGIMIFDSEEEAKAEIQEGIDDTADAISAGHMDEDSLETTDDFRVVPCQVVGRTAYVEVDGEKFKMRISPDVDDYERVNESKIKRLKEAEDRDLLLDDEEDFDSSINGLLDFDDEETEVAPAVAADVNVEDLSAKLETLINDILDKRDSKAAAQFEEIPAGELNADLGDFGTDDTLPTPGVTDNVTETEDLLVSEFPQVQDKIDVIKDRIDSEGTYADYLNGDTEIKYDTSAPEVGTPAGEEFDDAPEVDNFNKRSDDFSDMDDENLLLDDDFERNAELTSGGSIYEDEVDEIIDEEADQAESVSAIPTQSVNQTVNVGGMPVQIVLTGMMLTKGDVTQIVESAKQKGVKVSKIESEGKNGLNIIVECNKKKYKINYQDVSKFRNKMPFAIKHEKYQSLKEALERITSLNMKDIKEKSNFKKMVTDDIIKKEAKQVDASSWLNEYKDVKDIGGWNVTALGNVSLKTGINEVLSNITANSKDANTLVKTNEGQFFLIKGSLNEKSKVGVQKQLVDMKRRCEYGTGTVVGVYENTLKGLGQVMEKVGRTHIPLLTWK